MEIYCPSPFPEQDQFLSCSWSLLGIHVQASQEVPGDGDAQLLRLAQGWAVSLGLPGASCAATWLVPLGLLQCPSEQSPALAPSGTLLGRRRCGCTPPPHLQPSCCILSSYALASIPCLQLPCSGLASYPEGLKIGRAHV